MDDNNQREKLGQELKFLKESFEAEVISKEEFEKGRDRVEKKLKETESSRVSQPQENKEQTSKEAQTKEPEQSKEAKSENVQEKKDAHEGNLQEEKNQQGSKENRMVKYAVVFVVLALVIFFSYSLLSQKKTEQRKPSDFAILCSSNLDCRQNSKLGTCLNPGTQNSKCEFKEIPKAKVVVLNARKECFNCGTQRVLSILEGWFGPLESEETDYKTEKGKNLSESAGVKALPAYILDKKVEEIPSFEKFKSLFSKKDDFYVLSEDAAASTFYFKRENVPNKLDFFAIEGGPASAKAENNLEEFLDAFKDIKFEKHKSSSVMAKELNLKSFPAFLVNNRVKFSGIQPADTIKENFCSLNINKACDKELSKSLI